jgi:hypothetical protein
MTPLDEKGLGREAASPRDRVLDVLKTRAGVQQGLLLAEILAPPRSRRHYQPPRRPRTVR